MNISCIIPVHNGERYLAEALDSVLTQDWPGAEIIVVNDGSTDGTTAMLKGYGGAIQVVEQPHLGVSAARNRGIRIATGDVIAFQDADDIWPAGRLRAMAEALDADTSADIVAGLVEMRDERRVKPALRENLATLRRLHHMASLLIRRSVFDRIGLFDESMRVAEDTEFVMRARQRGITFKLVDQLALIYRLHGESLSQDIGQNQSAALEMMRSLSLRRRAK